MALKIGSVQAGRDVEVVDGHKVGRDMTIYHGGSSHRWKDVALKELGKVAIPEMTEAAIEGAMQGIQDQLDSDEPEPSKIAHLINQIGLMSTDIFEVVVTGLSAGPLPMAGLVCKKISDKAVEVEADGGI